MVFRFLVQRTFTLCREVLQRERLVPDSRKLPGLLRDSCVNQSGKSVQSVFKLRVIYIWRQNIKPETYEYHLSSCTPQRKPSRYTGQTNSKCFCLFRTFLLNSEKSQKMPLSDEKNFIKMNKRKKVKPAESFPLHTSQGKHRESHMCKMAERSDCFVYLCSELSCNHPAE